MRNNTTLTFSTTRRVHTCFNPLHLSHLSPFTATVKGWNISGCWRGAGSTVSGTSRSAPSTGWWISTELTASPWRKWSASETLRRPPTCCPNLDATLIPTRTKAALRSPSPQPASTLTPLTRKESPPSVCLTQLRGYDESGSVLINSLCFC